jgi:ABC-type transport system involved in multi-copper enzyme maturation permease subunit
MGHLFSVEVQRIFFRRLVRVFVIVAMAGALLIGIVLFFQSHADEAQIRASLEQREQDLARCLDGQFGRDPTKSLEEYCEEDAVPASGYDDRARLADSDEVVLATSVMIVILGWVIGASAVGAEWHTRNMTTLLTWEPRRIRVLVSKLLAAVVMVFLISMFLQAWLVVTLLPASIFRGTTEGADMAWFLDLLELMARIGFVAALSAGFGAALAFIGRNTAAALGAGFAYLAIVEGLIRGLKPAWQKWLIGDNAAIVIGGESENLIAGRSISSAALLIAVYAILLAVAAGIFFNSRDVP